MHYINKYNNMNTHRKILVLIVASVMFLPMLESGNAFAVSGSASASVTLSATESTSATVSSSPYETTLSSFSVGTGSNLLVVGVSANNADVASVTFGGAQLTKAIGSFHNNDAEFWYMTNPSGTGDIVVTMTGSTSVVVGAYALSGADLTSPIPTTSTNFSTSNSNPTISITTANQNSMVLDLASIWGGVTLSSPTCTQEWNVSVANEITGASSSTTAASAGQVTCNWTASGGGDQWDDVAIEVKSSQSGTSGGGGTPPSNCGTETEIGSNFNGNSIAGGNTIWFNSNMRLTSAIPSGGLTIFFTGQTITGTDFTSSVPDSEVIFSPSATTATTTFDTTNNMWVTTVPTSSADEVFLSGLAYQVPSAGLQGGENPVTWHGTISGSAPFSMSWKWGAAVYTSFGDYNSIGVKPVHGASDAYNNSDHAGTPENEKSFVIGGARGGGGSNWTGSWSATASASSNCQPSPSGQVFLNVTDMDLNGNVLTGYAVELHDTNGNTLDTEYSPATLTLNAGQAYQVEADSYGSCTFDHWDDTGATADTRDVSIQADTSLTAVFNCG